jgi:2-C-methyl-D-erythritol 2,4-cyclodiphosphate synthase
MMAELGGREMNMRVGSGYDVHAFAPGNHVMLGGVRVPHTHGVVAHSDGDVLLHALVDALLGAAGLGDIGQHFPDSDPQWQGADSSRFVRAAVQLLEQRGLSVVNADLTLIAQAPKIAAQRGEIRSCIASMLGVGADLVNIKATTPEHLGALGRAEGLAAMAAVLLKKLDDGPVAR